VRARRRAIGAEAARSSGGAAMQRTAAMRCADPG